MKYNPYCKNLRTRVFDIETTGLYPKQDRIISASFVDTNGENLLQFFCEAPQAEDFLISQIIEELSKPDVVITYNGERFDLPFLLARAKKHFITDELPIFSSLDIYKLLHSYWPMAERMQSLSQKSVEYALGLSENRTDEIGGAECIPLYAEYVNWNNKEAKAKILLHNGDDVRQLAKITEKLSFLPYHRIAFERGFMVAPGLISCGSSFTKTKLHTNARTIKGALPADLFTDYYHLEYDSDTGAVKLDIFTQMHEDYKFIDLKSFSLRMDDFEHFSGYQSGYLILQEGDEINHAECNALCTGLLKLL